MAGRQTLTRERGSWKTACRRPDRRTPTSAIGLSHPRHGDGVGDQIWGRAIRDDAPRLLHAFGRDHAVWAQSGEAVAAALCADLELLDIHARSSRVSAA